MAPKIRSLGSFAAAFTNMQNRLYQPPRDTINDISDSNWPTALQPVQPIAPQGSAPLGWSFWQGQNLVYTPRPDANYTAADLQALAGYPLARILIEQVKDSICSTPWRIQIKPKRGESNAERQTREKDDPTIGTITTMLEYPDGENEWATWLRPFLEDVLSIDAGSILMRRTFKGKIAELRVIPGDTITRYIDDNGWTPQAPNPAYAQLWEGIPRVNLTTDQLVYKPFNIVPRQTASSHLYGMSPTEQMAEEIKIGIERLQFVLAYYTQGSTPGVIQVVPPDIGADKILEAMTALNSDLAGNLARRRQFRLLQGFVEDGKDNIVQLKEPILADVFDELHIRKLAFGYGTSAQRLLRMMNRASSEANQSAAEEEGTLPYLRYLKSIMDYIIQKKMGFREYEWIGDTTRELDPSKQSLIDKDDVTTGIRTRNEVRISRGYDPIKAPEADMLMITTAQGPVPLEGAVDRTNEAHQANVSRAANPETKPGQGETEEPEEETDNKDAKKKAQLRLVY